MEERINSLEQEVAELKAILGLRKPVTKDWESTVGTRKDDAFSREADRLGEEWRRSVTD